MTKILDPQEAPEWFLNIFLETFASINSNINRFKKSRMAVSKEYFEGGGIFGCSFLDSTGNIIFIGRKFKQTQKDEDDIIEHYKYITPLKNG